MNYITTSDLIQSTNKPDKESIQKHIELQIRNFKDDELVCIIKTNAQDAKTAAYISANNLRKNLPSLVNRMIEGSPRFLWICPNPITNFQPRTYFAAKPWHNKANINRLDCLILDFDRANDKEAAATLEQLSRIQQASSLVSQWLADSLGIRTTLNAITGNGIALAIPINLPKKNVPETQIKAFLAMLQEYLDSNGFGDVRVDDSYEKPTQSVGIIGSINGKFSGPRLRFFIDPSEIQDWESIRKNNSQMLLLQLARLSLKDSIDDKNLIDGKTSTLTLVNKKEENPRFQQIAQAIEDYNNSTPWESLLEPRGFKLIRDFGYYQMWQRPGKEDKSVSLVTGSNKGGKDRLWCYSTSCEFPAGKCLNKYWVEMILSGIADKTFNILDRSRRRDFLNTIGAFKETESIQFQGYTTENEIISHIEDDPKDDPELYKSEAEGSLSDFPMPGFIEVLAQDIESTQPYHCLPISRAAADANFAFMIGKTFSIGGGLPMSDYYAIIANSGSGKEAIKNYTQRFWEIDNNKLPVSEEQIRKLKQNPDFIVRGGASTLASTAQGMQQDFLDYGRVLHFINEGEAMLFPQEKESPHTQATRALMLDISTSGFLPGRRLKNEIIEAVPCPFYVVFFTCPKATFNENLTFDKVKQGNMNRTLVYSLKRKGLSRRDKKSFNPSEEILKAHAYWRLRNLDGSGTGDLYGKSGFLNEMIFPQRVQKQVNDFADSFVVQHRQGKLDEFTENIVQRAAEHAIKASGRFTLAIDFEAREVTQEAWDLAVRYTQISLDEILAGKNSIKSIPDQQEEYLLQKIKETTKSSGISQRDLVQNAKQKSMFTAKSTRFGNEKTTTEIVKGHLNSMISSGLIIANKVGNSVKYFISK